MDNTEVFEFEDRTYANPSTSRDEQLTFIDTLRNTMTDKQGQVNASTYAMGSQLPSNLGGLSGGEQTFEARYRTPQLQQTAADLRKAAQASALNTALSNLQNAWKKRYNDAVLAYQKRAAAGSTTGNTGGNSGLPISTNPGTQQNLGVREGDAPNERRQNEAFTAATKAAQGAIPGVGKGEVFMYKVGDTPYYGNLYRDKLGNILGVETPTGSYNGAYGQTFLQQLAQSNNLFNAGGGALNSLEALAGLGMGGWF